MKPIVTHRKCKGILTFEIHVMQCMPETKHAAEGMNLWTRLLPWIHGYVKCAVAGLQTAAELLHGTVLWRDIMHRAHSFHR